MRSHHIETTNKKIEEKTSRNSEATAQLKFLMGSPFTKVDAMKLVRLGANPDTKNAQGNSLLHILSMKENNVDGRSVVAAPKLVTLARLR